MKYTIAIPFKSFNFNLFERSCNSILLQSAKPNEIIFIDDSGKKNLAKEYLKTKLKKYNFKIIKNKKNIGVTHSLNKAIAKAKSNLFFRLDIDDEWKANHVKIYLNVVKKYPGYLFYANNVKYHNIINYLKLDNFMIIDNPFIHSSLLINLNRKRIFYKDLKPEDYGTISYYMRKGYKIFRIKKKTVVVNDTPGSLGKSRGANNDKNVTAALNSKYLIRCIKKEIRIFLKIKLILIYLKTLIIKKIYSWVID
jgi:hypothetical protein